MNDDSEARRLLLLRLVYAGEPAINPDALRAALAARRPEMELVWEDPDDPSEGDQFSIAHTDLLTEVPDQRPVPLMTAAFTGEGVKPIDTSQSWDASETLKAAAAEATHELVLAELFAFAHPPADRLRALADVVGALAEVGDPVAAVVLMSQQLLDVESASDPDLLAYNVRLFTVAGEEGVMVMDTLGLDVFGLPDLQVHFRDLDPGLVGRQLWALAAYVLEHGDVIDDGHTVQGVDDASWRARHEDALVGPPREVIDLDPGDPWAAGTRER